jgi:dTDP-4-dehydrorhamnose reductase
LVYGHPRGGRENILTTVTAKIKNGEEVKIFNDQLRTPTYVEDLAGAIKTIIDKRATGIFHISGKDVLTPYEMAVAAAKHLNLNERLIKKVTEKDFDQPARRPLKTGFDISKAKSLLGYNPISFQEGLRKTFED